MRHCRDGRLRLDVRMPPELYLSYIIQASVYRLNVRDLVQAMTSLHQINGNLKG